jgi:excisionase family DNA binding protein
MTTSASAQPAQPIAITYAPDAAYRLLYRPPEAAQALGLSISGVYELLASGELESVKIGASRRITADGMRRFIDAKLAEARDS